MSKNNPFSGASYFLRGASMLRQPGIRQFVVVPLLINISLFISLTYFVFGYASEALDTMIASFPQWLQWLDWLIYLILSAAMIVFTYFTFTIIANFVSAPFNSYLSEAVLRKTSGREPLETNWADMLTSIGPALKEEVVKFTYTITRSIPFLILLLIPGVNFIASVVWLFFSAWMLALQYTDYPFANNQIMFREQREKLKERRWLGLGFGGAVMLGTMIPVINLFVVPSAVVGASLLFAENYPQQNDDSI